MKKKATYFYDLEHSIASSLFSLFLIAMIVSFAVKRMVEGIIVSSVLAVIFLVIAAKGFSRIRLSEEGIETISVIGRRKITRWENVMEVGVIGTKVFPKASEDKRGRKFLYFSPKELDEDARFQLALKWPPSIPYTSYSKEKLETTALIWKKPISYYNTPDLIRE